MDALVERLVRYFSQLEQEQGANRLRGPRGSSGITAGPVVEEPRADPTIQIDGEPAAKPRDGDVDWLEESFTALTSRIESMIQSHLEGDSPSEASRVALREQGPSAGVEADDGSPGSGTDGQQGAHQDHDRGGESAAAEADAGHEQGQDVQGTSRDPQDVVVALRQGDLREAEDSFGRLSGLNKAEVEQLFYRSSGEDLAAACRLIEADQLQFVSIFVMTRKAKSAANSVDLVNLKQTIAFFDALGKSHAERLQGAWRSQLAS